MKLFLLSVSFVFAGLVIQAKGVPASKVRDGLYLIVSIDSTTAQRAIAPNGVAVKYSPLFEEFKREAGSRIVIDTNEYVPLDLGKSPTAEVQTKQKQKMLLTLTPAASDKLRSFTEKYVTRKVAVVVDAEIVNVSNIREAITDGQLQITKCTAQACERLYFKLEDNVKRK